MDVRRGGRFAVGCVVAWVIAACGASTAQVTTAKRAEYKASPQVIFELAQQVAAETYQIGDADPSKLLFVTAPQFYDRDGGRKSPGAGDHVQLSAGSVLVSLQVEIVDVGLSRVGVVITPRTLQVVSGSPKPRELAPDDPNLPPWVIGRADALSVAIYERAKGYIETP